MNQSPEPEPEPKPEPEPDPSPGVRLRAGKGDKSHFCSRLGLSPPSAGIQGKLEPQPLGGAPLPRVVAKGLAARNRLAYRLQLRFGLRLIHQADQFLGLATGQPTTPARRPPLARPPAGPS